MDHNRDMVSRPIRRSPAKSEMPEVRSDYLRAVGNRPKVSVTCRLLADSYDFVQAWSVNRGISVTRAMEEIIEVVRNDSIPKAQF